MSAAIMPPIPAMAPQRSVPGVGMPPRPVRRITVAEYHVLIAAGAFVGDEVYELIEGWIVPKMAGNAPHDIAIGLLNRAMRRLRPDVWHCRSHCAVTLADSEPEPDGAIVAGSEVRYDPHHPTPPDIAVVIEVSDSTLEYDRGTKGRMYARAGIPVYWIVNVPTKSVEVSADPTGPDPDPKYRTTTVYGPADAVPGEPPLAVPVRELVR